MRDILGRVLQTGDNYANEMRLSPTEVHADERFVDCRVAPIELEGAALVIEITDVTRRNKISRENALLIQHGAGRQMIRQLAHEIKNPLGGIRGAHGEISDLIGHHGKTGTGLSGPGCCSWHRRARSRRVRLV